MVIFFQIFFSNNCGREFRWILINHIVFSVKSFERFLKDFSDIFSLPLNIYFLSVSPDDICLNSIVLHDIIVKKTYYLSMYIFIQLWGMNWWNGKLCGFRLWHRSLDNRHGYGFVSVPLIRKWERLSTQMMPNSILIRWWKKWQPEPRQSPYKKSACRVRMIMKSFEGAENIVVVTITGTLSDITIVLR